MKRDLDLIREVLLGIEANATGKVAPVPVLGLNFSISEHTTEEIAYHVTMLIDGGYVRGKQSALQTHPLVEGLTMKGHDYLDAIRDPVIWGKTKEGAKKAGGFTLELLGELAKGLVKTQIEKHTGVKL